MIAGDEVRAGLPSIEAIEQLFDGWKRRIFVGGRVFELLLEGISVEYDRIRLGKQFAKGIRILDQTGLVSPMEV